MGGGEFNSKQSAAGFPVQILVNYWEMQVSTIGPRLDGLLRSGVRHLTTFLPWQALESDINHTLVKFLQGVSDRNMTVSIILSPEVGVHYPSSGMPKDILAKNEASAMSIDRGQVVVGLPPNHFALPSLLSADFTKRYYGFLSRVDTLLADFEKAQTRSLDFLTLVLTGSLWKYYRPNSRTLGAVYQGTAGDFSANAAASFRQRLDDFFAQSEFSTTPSAVQRWKTHEMEPTNRCWFYQQTEAVFRNRTLQFARKKAATARVLEIELFTPEADPSLTYDYYLRTLTGSRRGSDFQRLSDLLDESAAFGGMGSQARAAPFIHWSSLGGFRSLTDSERQFLILKSLLLAGGRGGGVLIDEDEWFSFSKGFNLRVEAFARSIHQGDLVLRTSALYLSPHLWTGPGLWAALSKKAGPCARKIASLDWLHDEDPASLVVVDPSLIFTRDTVQRLLRWLTQAEGRVLALPKSALYSEAARTLVEASATGRRIEINLGVSYRLQPVGEGKLVIYDVPPTQPDQELGGPEWNKFFSAMLALSEIQEPCHTTDARLSLIALERRDQSVGLFVLNGTRGTVSGDILFPTSVTISDLASEVAKPRDRDVRQGAAPAARRFSLDVPSCGVLPLAVDRVGLATWAENSAADQLGDLNLRNASTSAANELPGFDPGGPSAWN